MTALASDALELANQLSISEFAVIGHDWGARAAYILSAQFPTRVTHCVALSVGYGAVGTLSLQQAHRFWYQWFFATPQGKAALRTDRQTLCRYLWQTWSPSWKFREDDFRSTAIAFDNPDWADVSLHGYRHRWDLTLGDERYTEIDARQAEIPRISVPTLLLHGDNDRCILSDSSLDAAQFFEGAYQRVGLPGIGHFPQREDPATVARLALWWLGEPRLRAATV